MRIAYDAKRAAANLTGLGNYSRFVMEGIAKSNLQNEDLFLYVPKALRNREYEALLTYPSITEKLPTKGFYHLFPALWRSHGIKSWLKKDKIDLYHGLSNEIPFGIAKTGIPSVVTIHDLIFKIFPAYYHPIDRLIYDIKFKYAARHADAVIAVSECTKRDIIKYYGIPAQKISVIYQGCDPCFAIKSTEEEKKRIAEKYKLPARYLLNVGTIEERKNLLLIVESLLYLPQDVHLVAVGRETNYANKIKTFAAANGIEKRVHLLHNVNHHDLPSLYQQAEIFVYPSRYEGFGIPVLEALNSHLPVVAASGSCLEEAGGPHSLYVSPDNIKEMATVLNQLLNNKDRCSEMIKAGVAYAASFSQNILSNQMQECYQRIIAAHTF